MDPTADIQFIEEAAREIPAIAERGRADEASFVAFAADLGAKTPDTAEALAQRLGIPGVAQIRERTRQELQKVAIDVTAAEGRIRDGVAREVRSDRSPDEGERAYAFAAKVKPLLDAGHAPGEILGVIGSDRAAIAALRDAALPAMVAAGANPGTIQFDQFRRAVDDAEIALLEPAVREARLADRRREGAVSAFELSSKYVLEGRGTPTDQIGLAFGHAAELGVRAHEPGRREWRDVVAEIDPEAAAKRARNSAAPELRDGLDQNARDVGSRSAGPAEMSGPEAVGRMGRR